MTSSSKTRKAALVLALREKSLDELAKRAETGEFSDFASPHNFPLMTLVDLLRKAGNHHDLIDRVKKGDFDHDS